MQKFILAFDQGTTSSRAIIFDQKGAPVSVAQKEFTQHYPQPGWVEHDPNEIWSTQVGVAAEAILKAGLQAKDIQAIGITNQRETTVLWDRQTGEVVYNAIVWQDRRTSEFCDQLKEQGLEEYIRERTGLVIDAYFSATKIRWVLEHVPGAREKAEAGRLMFGTIDTWLIWKMTGGKEHVTDVTNASRTLLYNIHTLAWDEELLQIFNIPSSILPEVKSSSEVVGHTATSLFATPIPIAGIAGDQQAALFGQMCTKPGMVKNTYGTGCFMLMNIGDAPIISKHRLVTTIAWKINDQVHYALEGSIFIAGAVVQWLRDGLGIISSSAEVEQLARKVAGSDGVYLVPAFVGMGAPHWEQHTRGTMVGMTRGTTSAHIARAALESIAYQTYEVLKAMEADAGITIKELRADGGATANDLLMQFQANILGAHVVKPKVTEVTAIGAAYLAGLATGYWNSIDEIQQQWNIDKSFEPDSSLAVDALLKGWHQAVKAAKTWV
ncbi:glycerol kinase GlpK [Pontibacter chinhatensis]|uniref:Glycerol kinase n=1 Tax=Pontibacter chinhatensis TaxID=1436961 RepID=A0A1I2Z0V1_9BACT|nr:glycerol kinase GlpK [Pontibacter chinhatensis]SFH31340.1 glycerol kinase [Pontibacter chinhatensis]